MSDDYNDYFHKKNIDTFCYPKLKIILGRQVVFGLFSEKINEYILKTILIAIVRMIE